MKIERITLAVNDMEKMIAFYNAAFDAELTSSQGFGGYTFAHGQLAGIPLMMCPNSLAGVVAEQNRHQFRFMVENLEQTLKLVTDSGGHQINPIQVENGRRVCGVRDPDGNSIELIEQS